MATFRELLEHWNVQVGNHQLPLDWRSRPAPDVVGSEAIHYDVVRALVHDLYTGNRCASPEDAVTLNAILDALGRTRARACSRRRVDIEAVALIERLGELALQWLHEELPGPRADRGGGRLRRRDAELRIRR